MGQTLIRACYPGTFNPPTVAHLAIAEAARIQLGCDLVEFVLSTVTLGKDDRSLPPVGNRAEALRTLCSARSGLAVTLREGSLLADLADGYDWVILGADKWHQIQDVRWYESISHRDRCLAALPPIAVAPRPPDLLPDHLTVLQVPAELQQVSSTAVRAGRQEWIARDDDAQMG